MNKGVKGKGKMAEFQGNCYTCGQWGHTGKFCPNAGKGSLRMLDGNDETNNDHWEPCQTFTCLTKVTEEDLEDLHNLDDVYEDMRKLDDTLNQLYEDPELDEEVPNGIEEWELVEDTVPDVEVQRAVTYKAEVETEWIPAGKKKRKKSKANKGEHEFRTSELSANHEIRKSEKVEVPEQIFRTP